MNKRNKIHWEPYFQFFISICWLLQEAARWRSTVTRRTGAGTAGAGRGATSPGEGGDTAGTSLSLNDVLNVNADFLHYKETAGPAVSSLPCLTTTRPPCLPTPRRVTRSFPSGRANSSRSSGRRTRMDSTGGSAEGGLATCRATWSPRSRWTTRGWPGSCSRTTRGWEAGVGGGGGGTGGATSTPGPPTRRWSLCTTTIPWSSHPMSTWR